MARYPNKNIGRWEGNSAPPDEPEPPQCEAETPRLGGMAPEGVRYRIYDQCEREGTESIDGELFCRGHADAIHLSNAADQQVKIAKEDPDE